MNTALLWATPWFVKVCWQAGELYQLDSGNKVRWEIIEGFNVQKHFSSHPTVPQCRWEKGQSVLEHVAPRCRYQRHLSASIVQNTGHPQLTLILINETEPPLHRKSIFDVFHTSWLVPAVCHSELLLYFCLKKKEKAFQSFTWQHLNTTNNNSFQLPLSFPLSPMSHPPPFHIAATLSHCINRRPGRLGVIRHAGHQLAKKQRAFCATAHLFSALGRSWSQRAAPGHWKRPMMRRPSWREVGGRRPNCLHHSCTLTTHSKCGTYDLPHSHTTQRSRGWQMCLAQPGPVAVCQCFHALQCLRLLIWWANIFPLAHQGASFSFSLALSLSSPLGDLLALSPWLIHTVRLSPFSVSYQRLRFHYSFSINKSDISKTNEMFWSRIGLMVV